MYIFVLLEILHYYIIPGIVTLPPGIIVRIITIYYWYCVPGIVVLANYLCMYIAGK